MKQTNKMDNAILVFPGNGRNEKEETFLGEKLIPRANACQEYDFHWTEFSKIYQVLPSFSKRYTRERKREKTKKKRSRDYSTPFLQPLNDAKKDRTGFLRRPEARPYWPVSIEIRTCASRPRRRLWPLDTGGPVVEIERGKKRGKGGRGGRVRGKNFRPPTPFVQQVLGSWPQMLPVCIHQFSSRIVRWKPMTSLFSHG